MVATLEGVGGGGEPAFVQGDPGMLKSLLPFKSLERKIKCYTRRDAMYLLLYNSGNWMLGIECFVMASVDHIPITLPFRCASIGMRLKKKFNMYIHVPSWSSHIQFFTCTCE